MIQDLQAAIPLGILLAFLLGPVFFVLIETAATKGFRAALALDAGVVFADLAFIFIAYFSTSQLLEKIKDDPALFIFGGGLLFTFGIISFIKEKRTYNKTTDNISVESINKHNYLKLFVKGFFLNFINIGVLGFWLTVIITVGPQLEMQRPRIIAFFSIVLGTYLIIDIFKILLAKKLKKKLTPQRIYLMKRVISLVIIAFGGFLIIQGVFPKEIEIIQDKIETIKPEGTFR